MLYFCRHWCYVSLHIWLLLTQHDETTLLHTQTVRKLLALLVRQMYLACAHMCPVYTLIVVHLHSKTIYSLLANACVCVFQIMPGDKQSFSALRHHPYWCCTQSGWGHSALHHRGKTIRKLQQNLTVIFNQKYMLQNFLLVINVNYSHYYSSMCE